jgi:alanyl-tRNA synthetase
MRIIADHVRSSLMLLADGVTPSNEGRGYILRRLMRRGIRSMRLLGVDGPTFPVLFAASRDAMKAVYPELETEYARLSAYAVAEEETFLRTLAAGTTTLDLSVAKTKEAGGTTIAGSEAFLLHDTYGFPIDLTLEIAEEAGLSVDRDAFDALMLEQRTRAKADARSRKRALADTSVYREFRAQGETVFTGYTDLETESTVLGLLVDGVSVDRATTGQIAEVILADTALYAESGGQVADKGIIVGPGYELDVLDVQKPVAGLISHTVEVTSGEVGVGQPATSVVDAVNRRAARQAHSATHLVHAALRDTLGKSATQAGSLNRAGYMRLDFTWGQALSAETRTEIEEIANNAVRDNLEVTTRVLSLDEARALGAMALFGEKYGDTVRMVDIGGPWSRELCAGTHVSSSAEVGLVNLVGESSVGASNRRVEALVGQDAFRELAAERAIVSQLTSSLKTPRDQLPARIAELAASLKAAEKKIAAFEARALTDRIPALAATAEPVGPHRVVAESIGSAASADDVRSLALGVRDRLGSDAAVVAIGADIGGRAVVIVATNDAARRRPREARRLRARRRRRRTRRRRPGRWCGRRGPAGRPQRREGCARIPVSGFRRGVRLGVDVGRARVGVARCDPDGMLATPVETVARDEASVRRIVALAGEHEARELLVGLPLNMKGEDTASTTDAREFAAALAAASALPVRLVDERLSTVSAHAALRDSGRTQRSSRSIVDQVAAVVLLQHALDVEKSTGRPAGSPVPPAQEPA